MRGTDDYIFGEQSNNLFESVIIKATSRKLKKDDVIIVGEQKKLVLGLKWTAEAKLFVVHFDLM